MAKSKKIKNQYKKLTSGQANEQQEDKQQEDKRTSREDNMKVNKKYITNLVLQEIEAFRENKDVPTINDFWLCNKIGYIDALLFLLDRHALRELFDEVHNKIKERG